jgi:hypothetical protein
VKLCVRCLERIESCWVCSTAQSHYSVISAAGSGATGSVRTNNWCSLWLSHAVCLAIALSLHAQALARFTPHNPPHRRDHILLATIWSFSSSVLLLSLLFRTHGRAPLPFSLLRNPHLAKHDLAKHDLAKHDLASAFSATSLEPSVLYVRSDIDANNQLESTTTDFR